MDGCIFAGPYASYPGIDYWVGSNVSGAPAFGRNGTYNAYNFNNEAVQIVANHPKASPLFLYLALQNAHDPNQAEARLDAFAPRFPSIQPALSDSRGGFSQHLIGGGWFQPTSD